MKCDECKEDDKGPLTLERVPSGYGYTRLKQICDDCLAGLEHYWDCKREARKEERNRDD